MIHVLGLEFDRLYSGEVRFQIYSFRKKLQAFTFSPFIQPTGLRESLRNPFNCNGLRDYKMPIQL
jgi:hypothetical protein